MLVYIIVTLKPLCAYVGLNYNNWMVMHGMENVKFINAQRAKQIYHLRPTKARNMKVLVVFIILL